ncbi:MAG: class I SAM-dependent methyltransferase [Paracoccaceae bacterium]|nr:class I SAM-dependent methyltransferase [Paracoccaceae bacterium]
MSDLNCRFCGEKLSQTLADLGVSPLCNKMVPAEKANEGEMFFPLKTFVCSNCLLAQLGEFAAPDDIFADGEYTYFSSFSTTWLNHAKTYVDTIIPRQNLDSDSFVVEVASNDGYLLQYFVEQGIPCLGIEPASNCVEAAKEKGVESWTEFFGTETAEKLVAERGQADLILGNNVLAHTPYLNDFVKGAKIALKPDGIVTFEFPHLLALIEQNLFDTIYHEHFSYFSLLAIEKIFTEFGLTVFDLDLLPTHGGSFRVYGCHTGKEEVREAVTTQRDREIAAGLDRMDTYARFDAKVRETKRKLLEFLIEAKSTGKTVAAYGAPGKGNTLLNYCGIGTDFIDFTVDRSPYKQGKLLPGSRIPVLAPDALFERKPDYVLILPWNLQGEITEQMKDIREWGGKFVVPIPETRVLD